MDVIFYCPDWAVGAGRRLDAAVDIEAVDIEAMGNVTPVSSSETVHSRCWTAWS
jgi:hypothetical protein